MSIKNIPDSIGEIVTAITTAVASTLISNVAALTVVDYKLSDDPGFAIGMYIEFDGYPLRKKILDIDSNRLTIERYEAIEGEKLDFNILLNYYYGNPKEIHSRVIEMSKDTDQKRKKFPLLALFLDIEETRGVEPGYDFEAKINMALIVDANKKWKPAQRQTTSFEGKLYPLYELFIKKCQSTFGLNDINRIEHNKTDKFFYSSDKASDQNTLAAFVDAIEITDFELKVYNKC